MSERLDLTQDGIYENDDGVVFDVLVHRLCAGSLEREREQGKKLALNIQDDSDWSLG